MGRFLTSVFTATMISGLSAFAGNSAPTSVTPAKDKAGMEVAAPGETPAKTTVVKNYRHSKKHQK